MMALWCVANSTICAIIPFLSPLLSKVLPKLKSSDFLNVPKINSKKTIAAPYRNRDTQ